MFDKYPEYNPYRTLKLTSPLMQGEDVYALQTVLEECGFDPGGNDGWFGQDTMAAVRQAQKHFALTVDGLAGGVTQKVLALELCSRIARTLNIPYDCFRGQLELESGYRVGNFSAMRPDGTYDAGVVQRNTKFTNPKLGFDCADSIRALGGVIREHYDLFSGLPTHRRWALAQGAWNAPAFACYIAREEGASKVTSGRTLKPSVSARTTFEAYVTNASTYL